MLGGRRVSRDNSPAEAEGSLKVKLSPHPSPVPFPRDRLTILTEHPLWQPLMRLGLHLCDREEWPGAEAWNEMLNEVTAFEEATSGLRFATEIRPGSRRRRREKKEARLQANPGLRSYEARLIEQGEVATRPEHPHDFFNAWVWLRYPWSKMRLHQLAYRAQKERTDPTQRSRSADSLTCFDEGGVFYRCPRGSSVTAVRALFASRDDHEKMALCAAQRDRFGIFGHGLMEGLLMQGLSAVQVSCLVIEAETEEAEVWDRALAAQIEASVDCRGDWGTVPFAALWGF